MWLAVSENEQGSVPMTVTVIVLVIAGFIAALGHRWAVMRLRRGAYLGMKNGLPGARKSYWLSLWSMIKVGFFVLIAFAILIYWGVSDVMDRDQEPTPATSPSVWIDVAPEGD
jgi:ABC-type Fe3+ transport system permease subunit